MSYFSTLVYLVIAFILAPLVIAVFALLTYAVIPFAPEVVGTNLNIGERNVAKVRALLAECHITLGAEDVGGKVGRSVTFLPADGGRVLIRRADGTSNSL